MPGFDKRGPEGAGPKTGRVMGRCEGSDSTREERLWNFFGRVRGRGFGRGRGFRFWQRPNADDSRPSGSEK